MKRVAYVLTFFDKAVLPYTVGDDIEIKKDGYYIVNTKFGEDIGIAKTGIKIVESEEHLTRRKNYTQAVSDSDIDDIEIDDQYLLEETKEHIPMEVESNQLIREATPAEIMERENYRLEESKAFDIAKREIEGLGLAMKLINVHFLLQKKKVIFNFTADNRIDFRQLVKKLASIFKTRIEMRQIGVRDAARIEGGYGICGELCCCCRSNCYVNSIFLKMAKDQGFVVNSSKLTGLCGRLMCCLAYENDFYLEERQNYPEIGSMVSDGDRNYRVFSVNVLKDEIYACDEFQHHKKFSHSMLQPVKADAKGVTYYRIV